MFLSHTHSADDPLPNLTSNSAPPTPFNETASLSSVVYTPPTTPGLWTARSSAGPSITGTDIDLLAARATKVSLSPDVRAYLHDIVVFLRLHRAVEGGVTALGTKHLNLLARYVLSLFAYEGAFPGGANLMIN
jgi:hypothetical protein